MPKNKEPFLPLLLSVFLWAIVFQPQILWAKKSKAEAKTYVIDPIHSSVTFRIRHLVSKTQGKFSKFEGKIHYDPNKPKNSWVNATLLAKSIDTGNKKRDTHLLRQKTFFYAAQYPIIQFKTVKIVKVNKNKAELLGKLSMHGVTKNVILDIEYLGTTPHLHDKGRETIGFTASTRLNRHDWGISWNTKDAAGGLVIGDEVDIIMEIEADSEKGS